MTYIKTIDLNKVNFILTVFFIVTLPFFTVLNSISILLLLLNYIALCVAEYKPKRFSENKVLFVFWGLFLIYLFSFLTLDRLSGAYVLEKKMSLLVFPLIFGSGYVKFNEKQFITILIAFVGAVLLATLITFKDGFEFIFTHDMKIAESIIIRRPYFGLYVLSCIFILITGATQFYASRKITFLAVLGSVYLFYFAYLIYAKMAIISFVITAAFLWMSLQFQKRIDQPTSKTKILYIGLAGIAIMFVLGCFLFNGTPIIRSLFFDLPDHVYNINVTSSLEIRKMIWRCVDEVLSEDNNWISGMGVRQADMALSNCYFNHYDYHQWFLDEHFNAHNEFLQTWLETGMMGLMILLGTIIFSVRKGLKDNNILYLSFIVFFFCCCFTESMFSVQKGIVFYAFFNSFLLFHSPLKFPHR